VDLESAGRLLPEGATTQLEFEIVWYFAALLPIRWGCDSLERARKAAGEPPAGAVRGEIRSLESWIGQWSVVEPVEVQGAG